MNSAAPAVRRRETSSAAPVPRAQFDEDADKQLRTRLTWLLVFRAAVMTVLLGTSIVLRLTSPENQFARVAVALYAVAAVSYASVLGGGLWLRYRRGGVTQLAYAQLVFDALIALVIVELTGGVESVFSFVFSLNVLNGAGVLQKKGARAIAAVDAALFSLVLASEATGALLPLGVDRAPPISVLLAPFLTNTASFALVALLAGFLSEQLKKTSERLDVARAQLERLEELYRAVLESLPSGVLTVDQGNRIVYVNSAGADILGNTPDDFVGKMLEDEAPALAVDDAAGARFERAAHIDARERMIGGSVARLTGLEGVAGRVIVFQDLTELRKLQQDKESAERLADLGRFAAGLAHEIRNPLAAMIGCLQLLRSDHKMDGALDGDGARMLGIVHREAERLSGLVSEFLTYARPSPPVVESTALRALADETVATMRTGVPENIALVVDGAEVMARCDSSQVRQALWNLIGNAAQAIKSIDDARSGKVVVTVGVDDDDDALAIVRVDDDGPGVPADVLPRIFEPFFTTRPDGTGLGLATVQQTLVQQKGSIDVGKSPLGGARFTVRLRRA